MPLVEALKEYSHKAPAYFCIPGHRFGRGISSALTVENGNDFLCFDVTEVTGLDDLHQPSGVIKEAQGLMAQLFHVRKSFFLVNGTTCGNEAMVLSTVKEGDKIIVPRNVHKSVLSGLILSGATPVYLMPEWIPEWNIWGGLSPKKVRALLVEQPDIKAVLMVSPSYYGIIDNVTDISDICREFGCLCMVDEAHGAHLYFSDNLPQGALECGADICVQSFHKVTGSLTQSSVLHLASDKIDEALLQNNLQMLQSSSPSYLLMASLDAARSELGRHGKQMNDKALESAMYARSAIDKIAGINCLSKDVIGKNEVVDIDLTRLVIAATDIGLSGFELKDILINEYNVEVELADHHNILAIVTFANTKEEVAQLVEALADIAKSKANRANSELTSKIAMAKKVLAGATAIPPLPAMKLTPREAHFSKKKKILWQEAIGQIACEAIIPYPPGIPVVYPGEVIDKNIWNYIEQFRKANCHFHGALDKETKDEINIVEC